MKCLIQVLFLSFITAWCFGQTNDDNAFITNSYDKKIIKDNKIDTIYVTIDFTDKKTERLYVFDTLGNLTYTVTVDDTGNKTSQSILRYNAKGQLISKTDEEEMIGDSTTYFYNPKGLLERAVTKNKAKQTIVVTYNYDKEKLVEEIRSQSFGKLITKYLYDTQGRLVESTTLALKDPDTKGTVAIHKTISYDSKGNKSLEEVTFFTKDTVVYHYDENNQLTSVKKSKNTETYSYDDNGFLMQKDIVKNLIDSPMIYSEKYRYVLRQ